LQGRFLRALEVSFDTRDVNASILTVLKPSIQFLLLYLLQLGLFASFLLFEVDLKGLHFGYHGWHIRNLGQLQELEDLVDVGLDFNKLASGVRHIGTLCTLLVGQLSDLGNVPDHSLVNGVTHEVFIAL